MVGTTDAMNLRNSTKYLRGGRARGAAQRAGQHGAADGGRRIKRVKPRALPPPAHTQKAPTTTTQTPLIFTLKEGPQQHPAPPQTSHSLVHPELPPRLYQVVGQLLHDFRVPAGVDGRRADRQVGVGVQGDRLLGVVLADVLQHLMGGWVVGGWGWGWGEGGVRVCEGGGSCRRNGLGRVSSCVKGC